MATLPVGHLAHAFHALFHGVALQAVAGEDGLTHAGQTALDLLGVLDDVGQAVGRIVPGRHASDPVDVDPHARILDRLSHQVHLATDQFHQTPLERPETKKDVCAGW